MAVGDETNGLHWPEWHSCELEQVIPALQELILEHYPNSKYATELKKNHAEGTTLQEE